MLASKAMVSWFVGWRIFLFDAVGRSVEKKKNLQAELFLLKNKTEMLFYFSIGPKIDTSVAPPTYKSTDHGLSWFL